ncbi:transposable element Tcb1 transposase [Trichonephila clavipes]|nr:transposable element Tcb1 transposase [Trichonephila clavipes]
MKTDNFWKKVTFSDEGKFNIFGSDGRRTVWRKPNTALDPKNLHPTVKHGGVFVMVWGHMASNWSLTIKQRVTFRDGSCNFEPLSNDEHVAEPDNLLRTLLSFIPPVNKRHLRYDRFIGLQLFNLVDLQCPQNTNSTSEKRRPRMCDHDH